MTITTVVDRIELAGTGTSPQVYTVPFVFWETSELVVKRFHTISAGVATQQILAITTNYTVAGGNGAVGSINVTTPTIETNELLVISRVLPLTQLFSFDGSGAFPSADAQVLADQCIASTQQTNGDLRINSDIALLADVQCDIGVETPLTAELTNFQVTRTAPYNVFATFLVASNLTANSPIDFKLHIGPLGTPSDPAIAARTVFFPGVTANTIYNFPVAWLNTFLSSNQKVSFSADPQFSQVFVKVGTSIRIAEYIEKT